MRALITRPEKDARTLAETLRARGCLPMIEPLLKIREIKGGPLDLEGVQAILITSANGARALAQRTQLREIPVLTVGEGSAEVARQSGFANVQSAAGDVAGLAALVKARLKPEVGPLFHAAGKDSAGDLKGELEQAGFTVRRRQLYEAKPAREFTGATRDALASGEIDCVLLFSPRTAAIFAGLWQGAGKPSLASVAALCLSPSVAAEVAGLGWGRIEVATKPDLPSMLGLVDAEKERIEMAQPASESQPETDPASSPSGSGETAGSMTTSPEVDADLAPSPASSGASSPAKAGLGRHFLLALVAGAVSSAAITLAAPLWLPVLGQGGASLGGGSSGGPTSADLAALDQALKEKAGPADIQQATDALLEQLNGLRSQVDSSSQELAALKSALDALGQNAAVATSGASVDLAPIQERLGKLEQALADTATRLSENAAAQAAPAQIAEAARQALEAENRALRDRIDDLARKIETAEALAPRLDQIEDRLDQVPQETTRQRRAALIVALGQLQSGLADDRPFAAELRTVQDIAVNDPAMWERLQSLVDTLSPLAEAGVPTRSQLAAGFPGTAIARAAEADLAGSLIEDAPWWQRLMHRISEVVTVRPVGGDVVGDGPLERLARAEADLLEGDLVAAMREVEGITGTAATLAGDWLAQAKARVAVDEAATALSELSARALEPTPGGQG